MITVLIDFYCAKKALISQDYFLCFGGSDEDRTRYLLHAMEALSQVSYGPSAINYIYKKIKIATRLFIVLEF